MQCLTCTSLQNNLTFATSLITNRSLKYKHFIHLLLVDSMQQPHPAFQEQQASVPFFLADVPVKLFSQKFSYTERLQHESNPIR